MSTALPPARLGAIVIGWILIAFVCILLLLFVGVGYSAVLPLFVLVATAFFASSPRRWHALQRLISGDTEIASTWSARVRIVVFGHAVVWSVITVLLFLAGNPAVFE